MRRDYVFVAGRINQPPAACEGSTPCACAVAHGVDTASDSFSSAERSRGSRSSGTMSYPSEAEDAQNLEAFYMRYPSFICEHAPALCLPQRAAAAPRPFPI